MIASPPALFLGFDPGRDKCGLAIVTRDRQVLYHAVVLTAAVLDAIAALLTQYPCDQIVLGDQTSSQWWYERLSARFDLAIARVDERHSSLEARDRYWQLYPPQGITRWIPAGMRTPPRPIDDIVAILLVERFLAQAGKPEGQL